MLRLIGRLAFPLFAWLIANGARHTRNIHKYLLRLFLFGVLSQIPYTMALGLVEKTVFFRPNVLFTLFLGLLSIKIVKEVDTDTTRVVLPIFLGLLGQFLNFEYGGLGVWSVVLFYVFFDNFKLMFISQFLIYSVGVGLFMKLGLWNWNIMNLVMPLSMIALFFIYFYNGKRGPKAKYLFYFVYPVQFLVFYLLVTKIPF